MGAKIINLLVPCITPVIFFLATQIAYDHGVLGLLGFSFMFGASFLVIYFIKSKYNYVMSDPLLKQFIYSIYFIETILCIFLVGKIILSETFMNYLIIVYVALLVIISAFVLSLRKYKEKWLSTITILLGLIVSFLVPTLVYLKVSIPTVYSGLHFLSRDILTFEINESWLLIIVLGIILVTHQYLFHMLDENIQVEHKSRAFVIAGLIAANTTIAFGSISFLGKAQAVLPDLSDRVSIQVINRFGGQFGQLLFVSTSIFISIYIVTLLWKTVRVKSTNHQSLSFFYYFLLPIGIVIFFDITLIDVYLYFGLIWGPLIAVTLWPSEGHIKMRTSFLFGVVTGIIFTTLHGVVIGILIGTSGALLIIRILTLELNIRKA